MPHEYQPTQDDDTEPPGIDLNTATITERTPILDDPAYPTSLHRTLDKLTKWKFLSAVTAVLAAVLMSLIVYMYNDKYITPSTSNTSFDASQHDMTASAPACQHDSVTSQLGMVSTTHYLATQVGVDILKAGGNAFDAAVAVQMALGVVQPQSTGLGGGNFILFTTNDTKVHAIDGREETPAQFDPTTFCVDGHCDSDDNGVRTNCICNNGVVPFNDRVIGGSAVGIAGVVSATARLLRERGSMQWADVLKPAMRIAHDGFPMYNEMYERLMINRDRMLLFDATAKLYLNNNTYPVRVNQTFYNHDLADTLQYLADNGPESFYNGELAQDFIDAANNAVNPTTGLHGHITLDDMSNYRAVHRQPINCTYRGYTVHTFPTPSSGGYSLCMMLSQLEQFHLGDMEHNSGEYLHKLIDIQDIVFSDRQLYMGDMDFLQSDIDLHKLYDKTYADLRVEQYMKATRGARTANKESIPPGEPEGLHTTSNGKHTDKYMMADEYERPGTTHYVIADQYGNVVSMTTTIEENFGSGVVVPGRGFLLNNELTDFNALPSDPATGKLYANGPEQGRKLRQTALGDDALTYGGKRPMSSMTPIIVFKDVDTGLTQLASSVVSNARTIPTAGTQHKPYLAMGSPGGYMIIGTVLNALIGALDYNQCIGDAVMAPRVLSFNNGPTMLELEFFTDPQYASAVELLKQRGFSLIELKTARPLGYVEALQINHTTGIIEGFADLRLGSARAIGQ